MHRFKSGRRLQDRRHLRRGAMRNKVKPWDGPILYDRISKSGCKRVAVLGLHAGAGTRTVVTSLMREMHRRGVPFALSSAPRVPLEMEDDLGAKPVTRMAVPEG